MWDMRVKRSVQTLPEKYQVCSAAFADAGDQVISPRCWTTAASYRCSQALSLASFEIRVRLHQHIHHKLLPAAARASPAYLQVANSAHLLFLSVLWEALPL